MAKNCPFMDPSIMIFYDPSKIDVDQIDVDPVDRD